MISVQTIYDYYLFKTYLEAREAAENLAYEILSEIRKGPSIKIEGLLLDVIIKEIPPSKFKWAREKAKASHSEKVKRYKKAGFTIKDNPLHLA